MPRYRLRLDPWAAEYDGSVQVAEGGDAPAARVDVRVETSAWAPVRPRETPPPRRAAFVDGVRRVEHRLHIEQGGAASVFGLLGSCGVGAALVDGSARIAHERVARALVAGGGVALDPFVARLGRGRLVFVPETVAENTPVAPLDGLQALMRRAEAALAETLSRELDLVVLDGPLSYLAAAGSVIGFVKRMMRSYLEPDEAALLRRLEPGERTPLFLVLSEGAPRYSWYLRLAAGRAIDSPLAGLVRLETSAHLPLARVLELADLSAGWLPRFASDASHDPRAPQNLAPVGALESRLRHRLGDPLLLRRAVEAQLHEEAAVMSSSNHS